MPTVIPARTIVKGRSLATEIASGIIAMLLVGLMVALIARCRQPGSHFEVDASGYAYALAYGTP